MQVREYFAIVGSRVVSLSNGQPYHVEAATGIGAAPVRRLRERGPFQHGSSDVGFRLDDRIVGLRIAINVNTPSEADYWRDELLSLLQPLDGTPIQLRIVRDDGEVRQLNCYLVGEADMPDGLNSRTRVSQRMVVQLQSVNTPTWYDPTSVDVNFETNTEWWLANGAISSGNVLEHVELPTQGQNYAGGGVAAGLPWSFFMHVDVATLSPAGTEFLAQFGNFLTGADFLSSGISVGAGNLGVGDTSSRITSLSLSAGEHTYGLSINNVDTKVYRYIDGVNVGDATVTPALSTAVGTKWRSSNSGSDPASDDIDHGAVYDIALTDEQMLGLHNTVFGAAISQSIDVTYEGTFAEFPTITIAGPITDATISNETTGETLSLSGTIADGDSIIIDLRYGYKTVADQDGANQIAMLTADSDLATFHLAPDPEVAGGVNTLVGGGSGTDESTQFTLTYHNRYIGAG